MNDERLAAFAGLPVHAFGGEQEGPLPAPGDVAWGVYHHVHDDGVWASGVPENFELFLRTVDTEHVTHLVIGFWGFDTLEFDPVAALVGAADRFPRLRALFLGDIRDWDLHLSWIKHTDITPLFAAFPHLEHFGVRGSDGLRLEPLSTSRLRTLRFEATHLPEDVVRAVGGSDLPSLERLDLWLGFRWSGEEPSLDELSGVLSGERLPALRHLGLENAGVLDLVARLVAEAPVVARLESLSLAMGTLTDLGAEALLSGQPLTHLEELDLHYHFLSDAMAERMRAELPGVRVDLSDGQGPALPHHEWNSTAYIAVAE